jgi:pimeloyl-ACP methyl ester carboxylesterase
MDDPLSDLALTHEEAVVDGLRMHYVEAGDPDGDLVVFLHGFPEFWYSWRYQLPALADAGYRVVAPDLRGYNRTEKPQGVAAYATEHLVGDVVGLVHHLGADSAHVVAHDWGGAIAWAVGLFRPDVVDHLVVMNAPHPAAFARELDLAQLQRSWYVFFFQLPWLPERLFAARDFRALERLFTDQPTNPDAFTDAEVERYKEAFRRPGTARAAINYSRAYVRAIAGPMAASTLPVLRRFYDYPGSEEIPLPTLVLWGEQDESMGVGLSEGLDEWVPDVRVEVFPEASHWVHCDAPEQVNETVLAFLPE